MLWCDVSFPVIVMIVFDYSDLFSKFLDFTLVLKMWVWDDFVVWREVYPYNCCHISYYCLVFGVPLYNVESNNSYMPIEEDGVQTLKESLHRLSWSDDVILKITYA